MSTQAKPKTFYFHLVSDATGSTLQGLTRAALVQFSGVSAQERYWPLIRTEKQLQSVLKEIEKKETFLCLYFLVNFSKRN